MEDLDSAPSIQPGIVTYLATSTFEDEADRQTKREDVIGVARTCGWGVFEENSAPSALLDGIRARESCASDLDTIHSYQTGRWCDVRSGRCR